MREGKKMEINATVSESKALLELEGKLTVQTSPELNAAIGRVPFSVCDFDIDIAKVDYIASAGLRVLVAIDKTAVKRGGRMRLIHPQDAVWEVFEMTGLSEVFTIER